MIGHCDVEVPFSMMEYYNGIEVRFSKMVHYGIEIPFSMMGHYNKSLLVYRRNDYCR